MKKMLLLSPLLLLTLTGCIEKNIITTGEPIYQSSVPMQQQPAPIRQEPVAIPQATPMPTHAQTIGNYHHLRTVQGSKLAIQERSNGFYFPQYQGKIVLLQLFGKDCEYCLEEAPFIQQMLRKYSYKLKAVALHAQDQMNPSNVPHILQKFQMNYPVIDKDESNDLLYFIKKTYGWTGILPYMLLIKDGVSEYSFSGKLDRREFEESLQSIL